MSTPHNKAKKGEIAKTVLMPGDPLRAKFIADNYLENVKMFNDVRNMYGYTGTYNGKEVSVMGSGMGMPSIGIYSYELYSQYDVENIIRIGSAGAYTTDLNLYDVVLAKNAYSESSFAKVQSGYESNITYPDDQLNEKITKAAQKLNIPLTYAPIHSADVFYREGNRDYIPVLLKEYGTVACEMESFALFHNAKVLNKKAACLVTISDSMVTYAQTSAEERQNALTNMIQIALEAAIDE